MRCCIGVLATILVAVAAGCGSAKPAADGTSHALAAGGASGGDQRGPGLVIPKDAQFTIYCATITAPDHVTRAQTLKSQLQKMTSLRDWYIVQGEGQSTLYHGFYKDERDKRAQEDRKAVAALMSTNGQRLFPSCWLVPLESADPAAPPEWNLENAKGFYTVQIAVYQDSPERKEAAIESVREARKAGYEAYYYHGPNASLVCIGAWPEEAVREMSEVRAENPNEVVVVVAGPKPQQEHLKTEDGKDVRIVQARFEVLDPTLRNVMQQFPRMAINGVEARPVKNTQTGEVRMVVNPSVVVRIPKKGTQMAGPVSPGELLQSMSPVQPAPAQPAPAQAVQTAPRPKPRAQQGGKLRSLED